MFPLNNGKHRFTAILGLISGRSGGRAETQRYTRRVGASCSAVTSAWERNVGRRARDVGH